MEVAVAGALGAVLVKLIDWLIDRARRRGDERSRTGSVDTSDARTVFEAERTLRHDLMTALSEEREERRAETGRLTAAHLECEERYDGLRGELSKVQRALREAGGG